MNRRLLLLCGAIGVALPPPSRAAAPPAYALDARAAALSQLRFGPIEVPLAAAGGGFSIREFSSPAPMALRAGRVSSRSGSLLYTATGDGLDLAAEFTPQGGTIRVTGEIQSTRSADRAIILRYTLPLPTAGAAVFEDELSHAAPIRPDSDFCGTVFPLAAMTGPAWGVALAIPPAAPSCFGLRGSAQGLSIEFYLGVTPLTKAFPNRARFEFVIDQAQPGWGFRSALAQYYARYPEFYEPRFKGSGFWNWQEKGDIESALHLFRYQGIPRGPTFMADLERNRRLNLLTFDYVIVGQRELRNLPELPPDEAAVKTLLENLAARWNDPVSPARNGYPHWRDVDLPQLVEQDAVGLADGSLRSRARDTTWGKNSVTFTMNPNPDLFRDQGRDNVGASTLRTVAGWYAQDPIDGIMVDSLGNQWPSTLNFRRDHFPYARYPLTFDEEGRVALHNCLSHYEFLESLRKLSLENHKYLLGNGICRYHSADGEHYNSAENGRFFLAAQLDTAGREITAELDRPTLEFFRAGLGRKLFTALLYKWNDAADVRRQMNRALAFDVFAGPLRCFLDDISYLKSPNGYARDREFLEWFVKQARLLHDAGWQPVTHARASAPDLVIERYGHGDVVYFTVLNLGEKPVDARIDLDLAALRMSPKDGEMSHVREIARGLQVVEVTEGETSHVRTKLVPNETQILKLSRAW